MFLELIKEVHSLLKQKKSFQILCEDGDLFVVKKRTHYKNEVKSALVFFRASLRHLRHKKIDEKSELTRALYEIHGFWMDKFIGPSENISDKLCEFMLYSELLKFNAKIGLSDWLNLQDDTYLFENKSLFDALNHRIDLGPFFLVELKSGVRVCAALKDLQKKTRYSKRGSNLGFDLYFHNDLILTFNKKGGLLKSSHVSNGVIRSLHG